MSQAATEEVSSAEEVSVIVPVFARDNDLSELERCLASLRENNGRAASEIIVVDDGSPNGPPIRTLVERFGGRYLRLASSLGPGAARNAGANGARGSILVFIDADCIAPPDWIERLTEPLSQRRAVAATSCYAGPVRKTWLTRYQDEDYRYRMPADPVRVSFVNGCNFAIERDTFLRLGGFPQQRVSEDTVFGTRLARNNAAALFTPGAGVRHHYHTHILRYLRQRHAFAYNGAWSAIQKIEPTGASPSRSRVRTFNPWRTFLAMACTGLGLLSVLLALLFTVAPLGDVLRFLLAGVGLLLAGLATHTFFLAFLARRIGTLEALSYIPLIIVTDITYLIGATRGALAGLVERASSP